MKRKKSQKRTAKSRKKHASENRVVKPLEPLVKQPKQYGSVDISLVPIKSPRRNVKPPKKYADEAFIYYNNAGADEFGIDPAFLCECALDISDPPVSEDKLNSSEGTETASENGDNTADLSNLCETVLITSDPADSSTEINKSTDDCNENAVGSEDGFVDLSLMCQTELITSDPADAQTEINRMGKAGSSEQEFILGLSDGEIDFASSMRFTEKEVCQKKPVAKHESSLLQKTENKENTTVPKRKAPKRRRTGLTSRRKRKKKNVKENVPVQDNETNIPTSSTAINVDHPRQVDEMVCSANASSNEILVAKPEDDHHRLNEVNVSTENMLHKEVPVVESNADKCRPVEENVSLENILDKEALIKKPNTNQSRQDDESVSLENKLDKEAPVEKSFANQSRPDEENVSLEYKLDKELPLEEPSADQSWSDEGNVSLENKIVKEAPVKNLNSNQSRSDEENVSLEYKLDKELPVVESNADKCRPVEENVSLEDILDKEALIKKPNTNQSRQDDENVSLENKLDEEVPVAKTNADDASLDEEKVCPENILDNEAPVLQLEAEKQEDSTTNSDEGKLCEVDSKPKQLMAEEKNLEECSVPDTDSGCDVDMEQGCDEDEHLNGGVPGEEEDPAVIQVPYFNETRIVKVLLHRLEDQAFFSVWKEDKQISKFALLDLSRLQLANNDDANQKVAAEVSLTVSKSKKSKKCRRRFGTKRKPKHVRCTNCNKKFPNEFVMKKHLGSHTCVVTVKCRICYAKFKSVERLLEHKESNCNTERVFACDVCGKSYALKQHLEKHQNPVCRSFTSKHCEICNQKFDSRISLKTHMLVHGLGSQPNKYLCEICGALFESKMKFKYHKETHLHLTCKQCGREFRSTRSLQNHVKNHSNDEGQFKCAECGKSFLELDNLKNHLAVHGMITSLERFECQICQKIFSKDKNLKRHLKIHRVKTEHVCHKCTTSFNTHDNLKDHITFCCGELGIKIKSETNLTIKEEKPYECHICGKCFSKSYHLDRHSVVHREQNPSEICDICGKKFKTNFHLSQHKLMVLCNVSSSNYFCKECREEFTNFAGLKMHFIAAHNVKTTVKCNKCEKEFDDNKKLRWHSITHSEGYWTSCKHCGKVITKRSLKNHIFHVHKSLSGLRNVASEVKVEPFLNIKVEEQQPNISNDSGVLPSYSRHSENPKPKLTLNSHREKNLLPCRFCGKILGSRCSLKRHVLSVHKSSHPLHLTESSSSSSVPKVEPPIVIKVEKEEAYVQNINYTVPSSEIPMKDETPRLNDKTDQNSLSCGICGKILAHSRSLRRHMISVHKVPMNNRPTTSHVVPKIEDLFNVEDQPQFTLENENLSMPERNYNEIKATIKVEDSGPAILNNELHSMTEQKFAMHVTSMQVSPGQNSQSYGSFDSDVNALPQTEQQVPEAPTSISCVSQNEYQNSEISNTSILMSQMINAQNYKMYLPNTSFLNSQGQNAETKSIQVSTKYEHTGTHKINTQPPQPQQTHYTLLEDTSVLNPVAYLSHEVPTSNNVHSLPIQDFVSSVSERVRIPTSNQYRNSEAITDLNSTSLLDKKQLDMIGTFICTPPPVQAAGLHSDTLFNIPLEESLTPRYESAPKLDTSIHTAPPISYNYLIAPGPSDISEKLSQDSNLTTQTSIPPSYQSLDIPDVNFKIIQQRVPVVTSTNRYILHQYIKPNPAQTTTIAHNQSPEVTNTFIVMQPKLVTESPRTSNTIVSRKAPSSNQFLEVSRKPNIMCTMCKSLFYSKEDLNKHLIVHGLEVTSTSYRCTACDQSFDLKYKYRAEQHVRIHTGEKPFPCNKCSERFRSTSLLNKHSLTHTKPVVPITCSVCQLSLSSAYSLRRHLKKVHRMDPPPTNPFLEPIKKESSATSFLENELSAFITRGTSPIQSEPVEPLPNFQQPYPSREISDFRDCEEPTSSHSYSYSFDESNGNHSDIALDLSDLRDDFVPDAMETVLKLENW